MPTDEFYIRLEKDFNNYCVNHKLCTSCKYNKEMGNCSMVYAFEQGREYEKEKMEDDRK